MNKFMKYQFLCIAFFIIFLTENIYPSGNGQTSGDFLNIDIGGRETAMGGAFTAQTGDINSLYYNPAGLANMERKQLFFMNNNYFADFRQNYIGYGTSIKQQSIRLGFSFNYFNFGRYEHIRINTENFEPIRIGTLSANSWSMNFGAAKRIFSSINSGLALKLISIDLGNYEKTSYAADLGFQYKNLQENYDLGIAFTNIGRHIRFVKVNENLPFTVKAGGAYHFNDMFTISLDLKKSVKDDIEIGAGIEMRLFNILSLRTGYNNAAEEGNNITYGMGFKFSDWDIDYSYNPYGILGNSSRFSLMRKFGKLMPAHKYLDLSFMKKDMEVFDIEDWEKKLISLMGNDIVGILAYNQAFIEITNLYNKPLKMLSPIDYLGLGYAQYKLHIYNSFGNIEKIFMLKFYICLL